MSERISEILDIARRVAKLGNYDSNIVGVVGEIIAEEEYGMSKAAPGKEAIDGHHHQDGTERSIQVKSWSGARVGKWRSGTFFRVSEKADDLLVVLVYRHEPDYEVLYHGPTEEVGRFEDSSGKRVVRLDDLKSENEIERILERV